ncbi:MAG TPA: lactate utilization protein [Bryobacteraceae bacterium]|nr:lactate utilization protein [Bryobacteraceae bacterium]
MSRDDILQQVRSALGRKPGEAPPDAPPARICISQPDTDERIRSFVCSLEGLAGKAFVAGSGEEARQYAADLLENGTAVASNAPFLEQLGIRTLPGVQSGFYGRDELRTACASAGLGITGADYALADTGTLVLISSPEEARLISLLPPVHLAFVARENILSGLDELFAILPKPAARTSSMVLITGPSRTADIEQILIRGVHGPGHVHVVIV